MPTSLQPAPGKRALSETVVLDCDAGRRLGCASFCCRLIVRLGPAERDPEHPEKSCVDKDPADGMCVHFDRETAGCAIWDERPALCRAYDCNHDPLLQRVLRYGFRSLTELVTMPPPEPESERLAVPYIEADPGSSD